MLSSGLSNFLLQNKFRMRINTAGNLSLARLPGIRKRLCLDAWQPCKTNLKPGYPAVLIRMRKYIFSRAKDLHVLSLSVHSHKVTVFEVCLCVFVYFE